MMNINRLGHLSFKQRQLHQFTGNLNLLRLDHDTTTKLLEKIFNLGNVSDLANADLDTNIACLKKNRSYNKIVNWFSWKKITQSSVNAAVILFLKSHENFEDCFLVNGQLDISKFKNFLEIRLSYDLASQIMRNITSRYLNVKFNKTFSMIVFGNNYAIDSSTINSTTIGKYLMNDNIKNKIIRTELSKKEASHAKRIAKEYFESIIMRKISELKGDDKLVVIAQIIYLAKMINMAARNLSVYTVGYETLKELAKDVFNKLSITGASEKIRLINCLILFSYHLNHGMELKRAVKLPIMTVWFLLPIVSTAGVVAGGITTLTVSGLLLGILGLVGAGVEGMADISNYNNWRETLNRRLNSGDRLTTQTKTHDEIEASLYALIDPNDAQKIKSIIPKNEVIKKMFCSEDINFEATTLKNTFILQQMKKLQSSNTSEEIKTDNDAYAAWLIQHNTRPQPFLF